MKVFLWLQPKIRTILLGHLFRPRKAVGKLFFHMTAIAENPIELYKTMKLFNQVKLFKKS